MLRRLKFISFVLGVGAALNVFGGPVIDSRDLLEHPEAVLRGLCDAERSVSGTARAVLHDPSAVAAAIAPELFAFSKRALEVCDREGAERGRLRARGDASASAVEYAMDVRSGDVAGLFLERVTRWAQCQAPR